MPWGELRLGSHPRPDSSFGPAYTSPRGPLYPDRICPANVPLFSPELRSHRLVSPIRLSVLGRTYGTYLHYERSYSINVFFIRSFQEQRLRFDLLAKASDSREISPHIRGSFPANCGEISPQFRGNFPAPQVRGNFPAFPGKFPRKCSGENGITSLPFSCS